MTYAVELTKVSKSFGRVEAVKNVSLKVRRNEFFSLLGPSGCGKTTTLRIIAGLEEPDEGIVKLNGVDVTYTPTHKRNIGMVFQTLALFPHLNVYDNIAFGLRMRNVPEDEIRNRVREMLEIVKLSGLENRRINQLSGGQRQRVALARALIINPSVLLLDEPLGALDLKIRQHMMVELKRIQKEVGTTFIYVTHDQTEAMVMSDRIAVMKDGLIQQVGSPSEIYMNPVNKFVASFIGDTINLIEGTYNEGGVMESYIGRIMVPVKDDYNGKNITYAIRPERIHIGKTLPNELDNILEGKISLMIFRGAFIEYRVETSGMELVVFKPYMGPQERIFQIGETVKVGWMRDSGVILMD